MIEEKRPSIYREWWVVLFMIALAVLPWFMAAGTIGTYDDEGHGWLLFVGSFAVAMGQQSRIR